ncbi:MAG: hypothetical protein KY450_14965, partial [Actinobacteria bacterium]|nr:hypothetical protein [Actinomycetota bacterium]
MNLASRLSDAASAGQVLVDESCAALVGDAAQWLPSQPLVLKGLPDPVPVRLLGALGPPREPAVRTSFVNRAHELAALDEALRRTVA